MTNSIKISQLPAATTPLTGAEDVALVQDGVTKQATVTQVFTGADSNSAFVSSVLASVEAGIGADAGAQAAIAGAIVDDIVGSSGFTFRIGGNTPRTIAEGMSDGANAQSYYRTTDLGDFSLAVHRARDAGVKKLVFNDDTYNLNNPIVIDRDGWTMVSRAVNGATFHLKGLNEYALILGNVATAYRFNIYVDGFIWTKELSSSDVNGAAVLMRHIGLYGFTRNRFFMESKFRRAMSIYSCLYGENHENKTDDPIADHIKMWGGPAGSGGGSLDGWCVENNIKQHRATGGNAGAATPAEVGQILLGDHVAATLVEDFYSHSTTGYGIYGQGTLAHRPRNTLNIFKNLNFEGTLPNSGALRLDAYSANVMHSEWGEGNGLPAIWLGTDSTANTIACGNIGIKGTTNAIYDNGADNEIITPTIRLYTGTGGAGIHFGANVSVPNVRGASVIGMVNAVKNDSGLTSGITIEGLTYYGLTGTPLVGLSGAANYNISDVSERNASQFLTAATSLSIPAGKTSVKVSGTTPIDTIPAGYIGQQVCIHLTDVGGNIRDISLSGGNIVLLVASSTLTSTAGRHTVTFVWQGDYWWEIA